jgi:hypothetical protein
MCGYFGNKSWLYSRKAHLEIIPELLPALCTLHELILFQNCSMRLDVYAS